MAQRIAVRKEKPICAVIASLMGLLVRRLERVQRTVYGVLCVFSRKFKIVRACTFGVWQVLQIAPERLQEATEASMRVNAAADALADVELCKAYRRTGSRGTEREVPPRDPANSVATLALRSLA